MGLARPAPRSRGKNGGDEVRTRKPAFIRVLQSASAVPDLITGRALAAGPYLPYSARSSASRSVETMRTALAGPPPGGRRAGRQARSEASRAGSRRRRGRAGRGGRPWRRAAACWLRLRAEMTGRNVMMPATRLRRNGCDGLDHGSPPRTTAPSAALDWGLRGKVHGRLTFLLCSNPVDGCETGLRPGNGRVRPRSCPPRSMPGRSIR